MPSIHGRHPVILVVSARWWPLSARLAGALRREGCDIDVLCPGHHPLGLVTGIRQRFPYLGRDSLGALRRAIVKSTPDIIVPCDDDVVMQLRALHTMDPSLRGVIEASLGLAETFPLVASRERFLRMASHMGIPIPRTVLVRSIEDLHVWHRNDNNSGVVKVNGQCGGEGVRICHSLQESQAAVLDLTCATNTLTAWKRLVIDCNPLALWQHQNPGEPEVTIQELIPGRPANSMIACMDGRLLGLVSVAVVVSEGDTGAALVVRLYRHAQLTRNAELIARQLQLTGFYGLDYMIDSRSETPLLLEINPRCTQLGHLEFASMGSLAKLFTDSLKGVGSGPVCEPDESGMIAFFPQAQNAGPACQPFREAGFHDVPSDEPALLRELELIPWPRRHLLSRIYHAVRAADKREPKLFESLHVPPDGESQVSLGTS